MERCTQSHGALCTLPKEVALPTRLIQIQRDDPAILKLCTTAGMRGQYVTLSYCWGDGPSFKAVSTSMESLRSGFEAQSLPKTLRDAVRLTYEMGFEYIWIDSLCIQQDNFEDWSRESARMAQVYGDAAFTICADIAGSTNDGIFQARDNLQSHRFGPELSFCLQTISQQWGEMPEHPLYSRGWAFQERILSSRNLHFLNDQIAWECNTTLYLEDSRGRHSNPTDHFAKSIFTKFYHAKRFQEFNKQSEPDLFPRIGAWNAIAQEMSVRAFTFESDNLPAISGLASALQTPELGEYLAGVWSYNPFLSMAWFPRWAQSPSSNYISPSWSWVWTQHQIVWHYDTWSEDKPRGPQEVADWKVWDSAFGPQLLEHKMIYKGLDPKGELLEGSYLVMSGYCRTVYVVEVPGSDADRNFQEVAGSTGIPNEKGIRVCMDMRIDNCDSVSSFAQDFSDPEDAISFEHAKGYLCVQIARERKRRDWNPKVIALVLEKTADTTDHVYKRVGLMNFDAVDEDKWDHKTLKLL
ncbi:HET-domain-containing protein [Clathrospora elynae]|uniref:HET-domain-containing protein n=1 Tax=Clathrospora elynae TaxID=706981 RepID=A0A6A5S4U0_9PLEO|nr:HET-domain-containing protein [Clathrospora elynae]